MNNATLESLAQTVLAGGRLGPDQAMELVRMDPDRLYEVFLWANRIRLRFVGPGVSCCSIIAAQVGQCSEDCAFCSQSAHYRTHVTGSTTADEERVLQAADEAASCGARAFGLVTSGLGPSDDEIRQWSAKFAKIQASGRIECCASMGILTASQAERLYEAGVRRINHNLQTSRRFFPQITTTHSYDDRLETLRNARRARLGLCCGGLFGMGETWEDRVALALELRDLDVDVVPLNFLIGIDGTPLAKVPPLPAMECLHIIALYRFLLPDKDIKIAGGREVHLRDLQSWIFFAGASSFLIGNYLTTLGRSPEEDLQMIHDLRLPLTRNCTKGDTSAIAGRSKTHLPPLPVNAT